MEFKDKIVELRKSLNLTQDELADKLFITRQAVSRWENGDTTPNIDTLKLIVQLFDISLHNLLGLPENVECQSCGMNLKTTEDFGTDKNDGIHTEYCIHCMQKGEFTHARTIDEMIESNLRFLDEYNKEMGTSFTVDEARVELKKHLETLKRWKSK